jgi:hypothetical protein
MTAAGGANNDTASNEHAASSVAGHTTGLPPDSGARDPWRGNQPGPVRARSEAEPSAEAAPSREQRKSGESEPFGGGPDGTGASGRDAPEAV